ncbi:hypothetical protein [Olsenella profusa]|uniref:Tetratricopeptide repeat protein n=1 Tax=Olsenella profusa TaxID=138595 RepID=A0ABS2F012_9ACTN|nr:hypothetical protein [Olsenella profusa]MBM6774314.1 hypothetical protein [Olsenella profusa]
MEPGVIAFLVLIVVYFIASEGFRRYYEARFEGFFNTGHYDQALETLNAIPARVTLTTYRQYYLRFLCYQASDDEEMATRMIELLVRMRNSPRRRAQLLPIAFNYFTQIGDKDRAKELLAQLRVLKDADPAVVNDCQLTYDIVFSKKCEYIPQMEQMLAKEKNPALQGKLCFLLWKQYANKGDKGYAKQYKRRFEELTKTNKSQLTA